MPGLWKLAATSAVWLFVAMIIIFVDTASSDTIWIALILAIAAAASTRSIWRDQQQRHNQQAAKAKRGSRVSRLMDTLDKDELDDLQAWMEARRDQRLTDDELLSRSR